MNLVQQTGADVASTQADKLSLRVIDWLWEQAKARLNRNRDAGVAKEILGIEGDPCISFRSASVHSLYRDGVHPDNLDPLLSLVGNDIRRGSDPADDTANLEVLQQLTVPIGQSQVRFGSPTSDGGTRLLFGYGDEGENNRLMRKAAPIELPFYWELDDVGENLAYRNVRGRGLVGRPLWRIVDSRTRAPHTPELGERRMLESDYLLVTRVRNYLGSDWRAGNFVVSFGGAHGTGTRAVELLAQDQGELARVARALKEMARREGVSGDRPECFQLLFKVKVDNRPGRESVGTAIKLMDGSVLDNTEEGWKHAESCIRPELEAWQNQHGQ